MYKATWKVDENDEGSTRLCKHINYNKYNNGTKFEYCDY